MYTGEGNQWNLRRLASGPNSAIMYVALRKSFLFHVIIHSPRSWGYKSSLVPRGHTTPRGTIYIVVHTTYLKPGDHLASCLREHDKGFFSMIPAMVYVCLGLGVLLKSLFFSLTLGTEVPHSKTSGFLFTKKPPICLGIFQKKK